MNRNSVLSKDFGRSEIELIGKKIEFVKTNIIVSKLNSTKTMFEIVLNRTNIGNVSYFSDNSWHLKWYESKLRIIFRNSSIKTGYQLGTNHLLNVKGKSKPLSAIEFYLNGLIDSRNNHFMDEIRG